ncbi:MAG: HlyC/CorC family transporter [Bacteroidetes bacterium]|nr:HlyC/CorC family transporter [Bacteroidota bacterium]
MDDVSSFEITVFFALIILSGIFSSVETAMHSMSKVALRKILDRGGTRSKLLELWISNQNKFLTTLYVGNNILNVGASVLASSMTVVYARAHGYREAYALAVATGVITFVLLLLGEVVPKALAKHNPDRTFLILAAPINIALTLLRPFSAFFEWISKIVVAAIGGEAQIRSLGVTEEEIKAIIEAGEMDGAIEEDEKTMIHSVIEFGDTVVKEIMVPRVDMVCVDANTSMDEILDTMAAEKLSRLPVYDQSIDTIIGTIHIKNIMNFWRKSIQDMSAIEFISLPYFVPETKKVAELLQEFRTNRIQMAIVVDEYGGTSGLVTMEDLIEEIVGDIEDEYDVRQQHIKPHEDGTYLIDSKTEISELSDALGITLPSENFNTVGGFILWILKRMPKKNEVVTYENLHFTITDADRKRIYKLILRISDPAPSETE